MIPTDLRYSRTHEWARAEGDTCTVGITQFAVEQLTDVVFVELPKIGKQVKAQGGEGFGQIESVKAVSDLYSPVSGEIIAVNDAVVQDPGLVSGDAYGKGWMIQIRMSDPTELQQLMTAEQYEQQIASH
jgi:glycine cleavage system H protein